MNEKLKDQDVLLVKEKGSNELHAVNLDKNGKVKSSKLDGSENPDFLKIDKNGNALENFFENFKRQIKDPTRFDFYRVPLNKLQEVVKHLNEAFKSPDKQGNKDFLDAHRINPEDFQKKQVQEQKQLQAQVLENNHAIASNQVKLDKLEKFGITPEMLEKTGISKDGTSNLDRLLNYRKTDLVTVTLKVDDETTLRTDARLSLRRQEDGSFIPAIHPIRHKPDLERPYFGVEFTKEDKENLLKTGNLGRVVEAEFKKGEKTPILLSIDRQTNELVAYKTEWLKIPDTYKGVKLSEEMRGKLGNGEKVKIDNMTTNDGSKQFSAHVQFNADKQYFELIFDSNRKQSQNQKQDWQQTNANGVRIPKKNLGVDITQKQQNDLKRGESIYVKGMLKDGQEQPFNAYIKVNAEKGKLDFFKQNPDNAQKQGAEVTPANESKTQVAVNSEGKTSEATKNAKEPLKQGQTQPTEKQAEKQKKSKG